MYNIAMTNFLVLPLSYSNLDNAIEACKKIGYKMSIFEETKLIGTYDPIDGWKFSSEMYMTETELVDALDEMMFGN